MAQDTDSKINVKKKQKDQTIVADNIDNTAPVKNIIEYLQHRNVKNKVYTYYSQVIRQKHSLLGNYITHLHFSIPGHPLFAFGDDWDGGVKSGYFESFPYRSLMPKMITVLRNMNDQDPIAAYIKRKMDWEHKITNFRRIIGTINKKRRYEWLGDDLLHCPKIYIDIAAHYENDPDKYFACHYNWYYAGHGNIHLVVLNGVDYLLHSEFSRMYLSPFSRDSLAINYEATITFDCGEGLNILETICSPQHIIALRTKTKVFILKIVNSNEINIEKLHIMESLLPYTGITFDSYHKNILYVITLDQNLVIVNLDRMAGRTKKLKGKKTLVDNWNTLIGSERLYYTHVTKKALTLYDKRTNNPFVRWKDVRNITDDNTCNDITSAIHCEGTPYLYFATDHHLFLMDMRYQSNKKLEAIQRWTHGMQSPPIYMTKCDFDFGKELVCLSSQWCEDMCVVSNYSEKSSKDVPSVTIPYRPPSILSAFNEAREKKLCCSLYDPVNSRLCTAISGHTVMKDGDNYSILMKNSLGDISCHTLYPEHMTAFIEDDSVEHLYEWSKHYKQDKKVFEVSTIEDFGNVWRNLKKIPDDYDLSGSLVSAKRVKYNEKEVIEAMDNTEVEPGLFDLWMKEHKETVQDSTLKMFFSEDE